MRAEPSRGSPGYFTDGGRLYRFIDWVVKSRKSMLAVMEDCGSLEILVVRGERLSAWREVPSAPRERSRAGTAEGWSPDDNQEDVTTGHAPEGQGPRQPSGIDAIGIAAESD
jgi:hypothetical protein